MKNLYFAENKKVEATCHESRSFILVLLLRLLVMWSLSLWRGFQSNSKCVILKDFLKLKSFSLVQEPLMCNMQYPSTFGNKHLM